MCYDDFYCEPSEFDMQVDEFKQTLRDSVKEEIKEKITSLEKELESYKEFKNERQKFIANYESQLREMEKRVKSAERATEEAEEKYKKARLHQLLGDYLTVGWKVDRLCEMGAKCDKCDENRQIRFFSPQGKAYHENCNCATRFYTYFPKEAKLVKFYVRKKNIHTDDTDEIDLCNRYYEVKENDCDDGYNISSTVYTSLDGVNLNQVNNYTAVFLNKEDCQKYCDWKNEQA